MSLPESDNARAEAERSGVETSTAVPPAGQSAPSDKIRFGELIAYGCGDFGQSVVWSVMGTFATFFLTTVVGLSAATAGTIILVSRLLDGVSDVIMGIIVDRTRSRFGKARPWLFRMALPTGIAFVLFFFAPDLANWGKILWVFVTYNLMNTVCFTAVNVPYASMSPLMTRHAPSRVNLNIARMICAVLSGVVASSLTLPMVNSLGGGPRAWRIVSAGYACFMVIMILVCGALTRERYSVDPNAPADAGRPPTWPAIKGLLANKYWIIITVALVLYFLLQNATNSITVFYFSYILGDENAVGLAAVATAIPMVVGLALMPALSKRFSKGTLARASAIGGIVAPLILLVDPNSLTLVLVKAFLTGVTLVPFAAVGYAMLADVCDYGYWKTGIKSEGLINSAASFGTKLGTGLGVALVGWILAWGGYDGVAASQPDSALWAMKFIMIGLPVILCILQYVLLFFYRLDAEYPTILRELTERETQR